ncbi:MAG: diaminohydroxyphosphoribosylaminopyrimidine deaminase [Lysobacterales bacterium]|jgi:diaminohydroxyphosphoribosylaminopyrimidine deaminase/5-amino-6-(5-phosphoribosylamino)uracil reductase
MRNKIFIVAKCAQTIDGKIATRTSDSKWITGKPARDYARKLRNTFDGIMVGVNTVLKDDPRLTTSKPKNNFKRIILDSTLKTSLKAKVLTSGASQDCIILTTKKASESKIKKMMNLGVSVIICPATSHGYVNLRKAVVKLNALGINKILIEGGAHVVGRALKLGLVDHMHIYIAPKILGDKEALGSVAGLNVTKIDRALKLNIIQVNKIGKDILIKADVYRNN